MKICLVALAVILCLSVTGWSQTSNIDVKKLQITWEIIENNYQDKPQFLSALTFMNRGPAGLPPSGWKIYFNFARFIIPGSVRGPVTIQHVNGDLFQITPTPAFKTLASGGSQSITFLASDWAVNVTDAPNGFYLVWDKSPQRGLAISNVTVKPSTKSKQFMRFPGDKLGFTTSGTIYNQNKNSQNIPANKLIKIFPTPINYRETSGSFTLSATVPIVTPSDFYPEAEMLTEDLEAVFGDKPAFSSSGSGKIIRFVKKDNLAPEAYELQITPQEIAIRASSPPGIFYGMQSLKTLFPPEVWELQPKSIILPGLEVTDAPRFGHRALMLDVARNFQTKEQVFKILDLMALYKLNVLHLHLNDDEGWRLEIQQLPELTEVGARRGHTIDSKEHLPPSYGSGPVVKNTTGTGFYSRNDFIDILKFARDRNIKVIAEIETPGHARAAIKAMDARYNRLLSAGKKEAAEKYLLRDMNDQSVYRSVQNWNDNVINVALPSVYTFLETVVDELRDMYQAAGAPLQTIHFGGDEVPEGVWLKSPAVQKLLEQDKQLASADDLWYYYFRKVNELLKVRNLYLSGWEEVAMRKTQLEGKKHFIPNPYFVSENMQVDVWNNVLGWGSEDLAYRLANAGYKVVLSNVTNLYFDMAYHKAFDEPGYYWGAYVDVDKPFSFIPYNYYKNLKEDHLGNPLTNSSFLGKDKLTDFGKQNIVGIQGLLWTETVTTPERMEYMLLPKLLGLAERAWAPDPAWATEKDSVKSEALYNQAWMHFANALGKRELPRLDFYAGGYQYRIPPAGALLNKGSVVANVQLPGFTIRYTTDGTTPTATSKVYAGPIQQKGVIKFRVFNSANRSSKVVTVVNK